MTMCMFVRASDQLPCDIKSGYSELRTQAVAWGATVELEDGEDAGGENEADGEEGENSKRGASYWFGQAQAKAAEMLRD